MSNGRGNQIVLKHHWLVQFKKEYLRQDFSNEELRQRREDLDSYTPDSANQAREHELRIRAINELLNNA